MSLKSIFGVLALWVALTLVFFIMVILPSIMFIDGDVSSLLSSQFYKLINHKLILFFALLITFNLSLEVFIFFGKNSTVKIYSIIFYLIGYLIIQCVLSEAVVNYTNIFKILSIIVFFLGINIGSFFRPAVVPKGYIALYKGVLYPENYKLPVRIVEIYQVDFHKKEYTDVIKECKGGKCIIYTFSITFLVDKPILVRKLPEEIKHEVHKNLHKNMIVGKEEVKEIKDEELKYVVTLIKKEEMLNN